MESIGNDVGICNDVHDDGIHNIANTSSDSVNDIIVNDIVYDIVYDIVNNVVDDTINTVNDIVNDAINGTINTVNDTINTIDDTTDIYNNDYNDIDNNDVDIFDENNKIKRKYDTINTVKDDANLYVTLDDIRNKATNIKDDNSETDSVTDSLIDRLWKDLELHNRLSTHSDNQTPYVSKVSAAEYVPQSMPRLPPGTLNYKFSFLDQNWKFIDDKIIRSPRTSAKVNEAIAKLESKTVDEYIIEHYENEIHKILNKEKVEIVDNIEHNIASNITDTDDSKSLSNNGLSYYDAQEVAISLASIRMFYKERDFSSMFKPSINLSQLQEAPKLSSSPDKAIEKSIEKNTMKSNKTKAKPTEPLQSKSSKTSPRKATVIVKQVNDKLSNKLNQTNQLVRASEISKYFQEYTEEKGLRLPNFLLDQS